MNNYPKSLIKGRRAHLGILCRFCSAREFTSRKVVLFACGNGIGFLYLEGSISGMGICLCYPLNRLLKCNGTPTSVRGAASMTREWSDHVEACIYQDSSQENC